MSDLDIRDATLITFVPDSIASDEEIVALSASLDQELQDVSTAIEEANVLPRIQEQTEPVLDALAWGFSILKHEGWDTATLAQKRDLMEQIVPLYVKRGTLWAVKHALNLLGEAYVLTEWFDTPPDDPFTYRLQFIIGSGGLSAATVARALDLIDAYGPARAYPLEVSALLAAETADTLIVSAVSVGATINVAHA